MFRFQIYIKHFKNAATVSTPIYNEKKGTCLYIYPVTFPRKEGQRLVGFSVVTYLKEILDRPYFQAKVFVFSIILRSVISTTNDKRACSPHDFAETE